MDFPRRRRHSALLLSQAAGFAAVALLAPAGVLADYQPSNNPVYDPPTNYYTLATGTGATLKQQLYDTVSTGFYEPLSQHGGTLPDNVTANALTPRTYGAPPYAPRVLFKDTSLFATPHNPYDPILWVSAAPRPAYHG